MPDLMHGIRLCTTGLSPQVKCQIQAAVVKMGGEFHGDLTKEITHVVAERRCLTPKYSCALDLKMHIVTPDWVAQCMQLHADRRQSGIPDETDFSVLPFAGFSISVTGFKAERRDYVAEQTVKLGGTYTRTLSIGETTHLIAAKPEGDKYDAAKSSHTMAADKQIRIVSIGWFDKIVVDGFYVAEDVPFEQTGIIGEMTSSRNASVPAVLAAAEAVAAPSVGCIMDISGDDLQVGLCTECLRL